MNTCRLCGEEKSPQEFHVELNDRTPSNWNYQDLIEHHTRVVLKANKLLPQSICEDCRLQVDSFAEFSNRVQLVQSTFQYVDDEEQVQFVQLQPMVETIFPETNMIIKELLESDASSSDSDNNSTSRDVSNQASTHVEENMTYEEVFDKELNAVTITKFDLHLDVPESVVYPGGEVPESALTLLNPTRWSHMVKSCEACDASFKNLIEFNSHQESHHNTKTVKVPCILCSHSFKKVYSYINHVLSKHYHLEHLRYCCLVCDEMFYSLAPLYKHVKALHEAETRGIYQCVICGLHFEGLGFLKKHKRVHDFDRESDEIVKLYASMKDAGQRINLTIEDCYKNEDGTIKAERQEGFIKWTSYKISCFMCETINLTPIEYYSHHHNEHMEWSDPTKAPIAYKFSCQDCPEEAFASLVAFVSHQIYKHGHEDLSFRCIVCERMFWSHVAYSRHLKYFHPSLRQFLCMLCGKMVERFSVFRHHLTAVHGSSETGCAKRTRTVNKPRAKAKRSKSEKIIIKEESDSEVSFESESESDYISSDDVPLKQKQKKKKSKKEGFKNFDTKNRRPNNRHRTEKQTLFGSELDSPLKLYAEEISGESVFPSSLHINVYDIADLQNGEVSESLAKSQGLSSLRWRDLLVCAICRTKYSNIISLTAHIEKNHGARTRAFGCLNCDFEYGALYESSLVNHLVERHYLEHLKFCCLLCSKLFYDLLSLVQHYAVHSGEFEILVCFICGFYAKTLDDLKEHKAYHVQIENAKPDNQTLCENVLEKFAKGIEKNTINREVAEYERKPDGTVSDECQQRFLVDWSFAQYQCPLCFAQHSNPFELNVHLRLKHPKDQDQTRKIYSCKTCLEKKEFSGLHYFINHAAESHFPSLRFTCVVCSRLFWNYLALVNHYKNVHPSFTNVFCCHCGKIYHSITAGAIHYKKIMIMLTDEEKKLKKEGKLDAEESSHICHVCGKACKSNYTLVKHITTHEEPDPSKMLQCHICSKLFNTKNKLNQHMVGHNNLRKWKCKTCGMSFNFKKLLQMHTRAVHENERSFGCSFCEKKFFKKYDLTVHVRLHTGDFPYACPVIDCDAKYPAWSNLFKHCQSRHKLDIRSEGYKKLRASEKAVNNDGFGSE